MSRDYSYEIYSLRQQISTMSSERADILNKISILKQNKSKIQSKKSAISEQLSQYDLIKAKATSNFAGNRRDDFNNKIETLKGSISQWLKNTQNKSKIQSKKSAISEQLSQYDLIKAKATSNFAGNRRDDFNNKIETLKGSISQWLKNTQNNIDLIDQKISTYTAEASNLAIGMNYASQSLNTYIYLQSQNED